MIWYAVEIVFLCLLAAGGVGLYIFLVHSPAFSRFLARLTQPTEAAAEEELDRARFNTAEILAEARQDIKDKAARAARLKKKL